MHARKLILSAVVIGLTALPAAYAETFPGQPITLVVPFAAGGPTDVSARLFGQVMSERLGQPVVVENRPGAGGTVGSTAVSEAEADGYTLLWGGTSSIVVAPSLYDDLRYDPIDSFTPIGMAVRGPVLLVGRSSLETADLSSLIELARSEELTVASAGTGSIGHLTAEMFKDATQADLLHIPYQGGAPALVDVVGGQVDIFFDTLTLLHAHIERGDVRIFGVASGERHDALPDVPTIEEEIGAPFEAYSWFGLFAPAGTPDDVVEALSQALAAGAEDPEVIRQMEATGLEPVGGTADEFARDISSDLEKWTGVVERAGVIPE